MGHLRNGIPLAHVSVICCCFCQLLHGECYDMNRLVGVGSTGTKTWLVVVGNSKSPLLVLPVMKPRWECPITRVPRSMQGVITPSWIEITSTPDTQTWKDMYVEYYSDLLLPKYISESAYKTSLPLYVLRRVFIFIFSITLTNVICHLFSWAQISTEASEPWLPIHRQSVRTLEFCAA